MNTHIQNVRVIGPLEIDCILSGRFPYWTRHWKRTSKAHIQSAFFCNIRWNTHIKRTVTLHFVSGHFVPWSLCPGHFVLGHLVSWLHCLLLPFFSFMLSPGHFVPWSLCPLVILSPGHFVPSFFVPSFLSPVFLSPALSISRLSKALKLFCFCHSRTA
jgi:hypothetical protein